MAERDSGLPEREQRWRERLTLFEENEELLTTWNGGATETNAEVGIVVGAVAMWYLCGTNQRLLWNPNDRNSVEGGSTVAGSMNGS
ncbi:hypothetical protein DEO72_LG7g899 [Vigna unguiculata]|uniref:Uncharacterized protein n=1 Tax=Vigna unguiculata TaxID=3917 RepID=A0A4D6ME31_VIGUN|nr:hypothetical protein DEO72_LG7g899 [Vigna unguiculata]